MSDALREWSSIVPLVSERVAGLREPELDDRFGAEALSVREVVHHIAEANVVAASIVIAALGSPGCTFDWSWMLPFGPWMDRLAYRTKPVGPSLDLLRALNVYVAAQVAPLADGLDRHVWLRDAPDAELRRTTVGAVLLQEVEHARHHLDELRPGRRE